MTFLDFVKLGFAVTGYQLGQAGSAIRHLSVPDKDERYVGQKGSEKECQSTELS